MSFLLRFNRLTLQICFRNISASQRHSSADIKDTQDQTVNTALETDPVLQNVEKKGFAKAYESHSESLKPKEEPKDTETFASLLRNSKFIDVSKNMDVYVYICIIYLQRFSSSLVILKARLFLEKSFTLLVTICILTLAGSFTVFALDPHETVKITYVVLEYA